MQQDNNRYICADLIQIRFRHNKNRWRRTYANLEEISAQGASLLTDAKVPPGSRLQLLTSTRKLTGTVCHTSKIPELGHCIGIRFDPDSAWTPDKFMPEHLLSFRELAAQAPAKAAAEPPCSCCMAACPVLPEHKRQSDATLTADEVRSLAKAVANSCPTLTEAQLATCFQRLGRSGNESFPLFQRTHMSNS